MPEKYKQLNTHSLHQQIMQLEKENGRLSKENLRYSVENKELRSIFDVAVDTFNRMNKELLQLQKEHEATKKHYRDLEKEKNKLEKKASDESAKANKFASMIFGLKSEKIKLSDIKVDKTTIEITPASEDSDDSDKDNDTEDTALGKGKDKPPKKKKGGQSGHKGSGRKIPNDLPVLDEIIVLPEDKEFHGIPSNEWIPCKGMYEEAFIIKKKVIWYRVRLLRQKYHAPENAGTDIPQIIVAPVPDKLIKKGKYDTGVWVDILNEKYQQHVPIERQVFDAQQAGVNLFSSTVFGGLKYIYERYLEPLYKELIFELQKGERWHADETRWYMLCDKSRKLWYMWGFKTEKITAFILDPTRSAAVPAKALLNIDDIYSIKEPVQIPMEKKKILNVDRYSSYKMLQRLGFLILSFCWAHQRRDFTDIVKKYPKNINIIQWAEAWLIKIAQLYKINNKRIKHPPNSEIFLEYDMRLREMLDKMHTDIQNEIIVGNKKKKQLKENEILDETSDVKLGTMISMNNHWEGLIIFVDNPEIPMDNNIMENGIRPVALGRNNYTGSQSQWGGDLAACMYSIVQTCKQNMISPKAYLQYFFERCIKDGINKNNADLMNSLLPHNLKAKVIADHRLELKKY